MAELNKVIDIPLVILIIITLVVFYLLVKNTNTRSKKLNREKFAKVWGYTENDVVYWRWYCPHDHFGLYDFKTKRNAIKSLKMMGYWTEQ